jgi:hypothetical protein
LLSVNQEDLLVAKLVRDVMTRDAIALDDGATAADRADPNN